MVRTKPHHSRVACASLPLVVLLSALGCGQEVDLGSEKQSLVGGWSTGEGHYACFLADHTAGFGDHPGEAETAHPLTWSDDGHIYGDSLAGASVEWWIQSLTLTVVSHCDGPGCGELHYHRDMAVDCASGSQT